MSSLRDLSELRVENAEGVADRGSEENEKEDEG
jgi:hypothetical protein